MIAALFPGQGIDPKVVLAALQRFPERAAEAQQVLGYDVVRRIDQVCRGSRGSMPTSLGQPAIFVAGIAAFEEATDEGASFDALLGHSLGEYTALTCAGSMSFAAGLALVARRGAAMERAARGASGGMAAVLGLDLDLVQSIASNEGLTIANDNAPHQVVLSGPRDDLARAAQAIRSARGRCVLLPVDGAFHSSAMQPAGQDLMDALDAVEIRSPSVPIVSNVTALPYRSPGEIRRLLVRQLTEQVKFRDCLVYLESRGVTEFRDLGPGSIVGGLARSTIGRVREAADA